MGAGGIRRLRICSDHFRPEMYKDAAQPRKGLHDNAIPCSDPIGNDDVPFWKTVQLKIEPMDQEPRQELASYADQTEEEMVIEALDDESDMQIETEIETSSRPLLDPVRSKANNDVDKPDFKTLYCHEREKNRCLENTVKELRKSLRSATRKSERRFRSMQTKKIRNRRLKIELNQLRKQKLQDKKLLQLVKNNAVLRNSLLNSTRAPKTRRYNKEMKKFAINIYLTSPAAFRFIRKTKILVLPSKTTVRRWNSDVVIEPGLSETILNRLGSKAKSFSRKERAVSICIDGMALKAELVYNAKSDKFIGFPDDGVSRRIEKNNPLVLATEAVTVMVSGMCPLEPSTRPAIEESAENGKLRRFKQVVFRCS